MQVKHTSTNGEHVARGVALSAALAKPHAVSALLALAQEPGISAAKLARRMGASQPITGKVMAEHLAEFGLVVIKFVPGPFDQDATAISLTERGEKLAKLLERGIEFVPDDVPAPPVRKR